MEKKWFVGIDVSKKTIDVVYYDRKRQKMCEEIHRQFSNDQSGFILMRKWFKGKPPVKYIFYMSSRHLIFAFLTTKAYDYDEQRRSRLYCPLLQG
ncbi:MAG: hypothetical protein LUE99_04095 [Bacteroides sp.]|nr:hypothetical protein [Tannerellaceae bacterium]MCD8182394.1 hypothetical protein [Bacteroides sp.]